MVLSRFSAGRIVSEARFEARFRGAGTIRRYLDSFSLIAREPPPVAPFRQCPARLSFLMRLIAHVPTAWILSGCIPALPNRTCAVPVSRLRAGSACHQNGLEIRPAVADRNWG